MVLIGVGAWVETQDQPFRTLAPGQEFLFGPYLIIAAGCAALLVSVIGMVGALCETKVNKFLLGFVSSSQAKHPVYQSARMNHPVYMSTHPVYKNAYMKQFC